MSKQLSTKDLISAWEAGAFANPDRKIQIKAGWYDWFCKESSLAAKTDKLYKKAQRILNVDKGRKIDVNKTYIWFKNNCPMLGKIYDDFRIADMKTGDVIYTIVPSSGYAKNMGEAELWGRENDFDSALVKGTWNDILKFFK
jgi:hypothetical protein